MYEKHIIDIAQNTLQNIHWNSMNIVSIWITQIFASKLANDGGTNLWQSVFSNTQNDFATKNSKMDTKAADHRSIISTKHEQNNPLKCYELMNCHMHINSSPPGQNGRHFADNTLRCIFANEKFCILITTSLKFVPKGVIDNNPSLV